MKDFIIECKKQKRLRILLAPFLFLGIIFLWIVAGNRTLTSYEQAQGYTDLLYTLPLLHSILMPIMLAVIASQLWDMEIKGQTMRLLFTMQKKQHFYDCKYFSELLLLLFFCVGEIGMFPLIGKILNYTQEIPLVLLYRHAATTFLAGSVVLTLQHILSLLFSNQIIPLLVGLMGAFLGLFSMFFPSHIARIVLWSYFAAFIPFGMNYDEGTRIISYYPLPFPLKTFVGFSLFGIAFYLLCRYIFMKKEV